jgi:hypothetical protein
VGLFCWPFLLPVFLIHFGSVMVEVMMDVVIRCGKEDVALQLCPADFQFAEFDRWVRNRFDTTPDQKIAFRDAKGSGTAYLACRYATKGIA